MYRIVVDGKWLAIAPTIGHARAMARVYLSYPTVQSIYIGKPRGKNETVK
jgi:hypothetical protein